MQESFEHTYVSPTTPRTGKGRESVTIDPTRSATTNLKRKEAYVLSVPPRLKLVSLYVQSIGKNVKTGKIAQGIEISTGQDA